MSNGYWVTFHELGRKYQWSPATREVRTMEGGRIGRTEHYNLDQARTAARRYSDARRSK